MSTTAPLTSTPSSGELRSSKAPQGENGRAHPIDAVDEGVANLLKNVQQGVSHRYADCESYVKRSPGNAMLTAFAAGYLFKMLPVEAIVAAQVRLALSLVRPALFVYGAAKAYEYLARHQTHPEGGKAQGHL